MIYEGDWNNDKRNGEGTIVKCATGEVLSGDFRNDMFEGRQKFERILTKSEVERYFKQAMIQSETFITVSPPPQ